MSSETRSFSISWPQILLMGVIIAGIYFRFAGLDSKIYWHDEAYTSLWISGHSLPEAAQGLFRGRLLTPEAIQTYQRLNPNTNLIDVFQILADYDTQHPPLYYGILRLWVEGLGDSILSIRVISVLLSLLAFPFAYWLGWELFRSHLAAGICLGMIALSPFHVVYAQEAREYGLWTGMILFSHAALVRSLRQPSNRNWLLYIISLILGLYTFLFTALVMAAQGLYVLIHERFQFTKPLKDYGYACLISLLAFTPWLIELFTNPDPIQAAGWTSRAIPISTLVQAWGTNLSRLFFDVDLELSPVIFGLIAIVLVYALVSLRHSPLQIWGFIGITTLLPALFLVLPDLAVGGIRSFVSRYLIPTWLGVQLLVAHYATAVIRAEGSAHLLIQRVVLILVLVGSLLSCLIIPQEETWWTKGISQHQPSTVGIINQAEQPLVISDYSTLNLGEILSMSYRLDPQVRLLLLPEPDLRAIPQGFSDVFLFNPSPALRQDIETDQIPSTLIHEPGNLWELSQ